MRCCRVTKDLLNADLADRADLTNKAIFKIIRKIRLIRSIRVQNNDQNLVSPIFRALSLICSRGLRWTEMQLGRVEPLLTCGLRTRRATDILTRKISLTKCIVYETMYHMIPNRLVWEEFPVGPQGAVSGLHVTINRKGEILGRRRLKSSGGRSRFCCPSRGDMT